jgi:lipopolysaccharide biosynthesis glycosyltransferase
MMHAAGTEMGPSGVPVDVAVHFDQAYAVHAATMVRSLLDNAGSDCHVRLYVLGVGISPEIRAKLEASWISDRLTVHWIDVNLAPFRQLLSGYDYPSVAYSRILFDWLLPHDVSRVVSLDCDGLVLGDIADLWREAPERGCVKAVSDPGIRRLGKDGSPFVREVSAGGDAPYFNSGVMVVDLDRWRQLGVTVQCLDLARRYPRQSVYADQSLLNVVLRDEWERMPLRWNCNAYWISEGSFPTFRETLVATEEIKEAGRKPGFVHFVGRGKPWNTDGYHPHARLYRHYQNRTAWALHPEAPASPRQRMRLLYQRARFPVDRFDRVQKQAAVHHLRRRRVADVAHLSASLLVRRSPWRTWGHLTA